METPKNKVEAKTACIAGHLFVIAAHGGRYDAGRGVAIVQGLKTEKPDLPPQPIKCDKRKRK